GSRLHRGMARILARAKRRLERTAAARAARRAHGSDRRRAVAPRRAGVQARPDARGVGIAVTFGFQPLRPLRVRAYDLRMDPALPDEAADPRMTVDEYLALFERGVLGPDDRVELLDGVVVAMAPPNPPHCGNTERVARALRRAVGERAHVREEKPLIVGRHSLPEPDAAVVPVDPWDYTRSHPETAFLLVEVSDSSLPQDRLSKSRIYAGDGVPEYWIVNLR